MPTEAFTHYKRAVEAYAQASALAARTDDPRHRKHARDLRAIATEREAAWRAEKELRALLRKERPVR